ncbi:hypothetical protein Atc_2041 [Acidithiobacillus caldus SM-1]|uniref:Toxin co-regulated pilus biosynthesis protein Q C-terminal domain-containing protein n=1 Tax=Acidithiobacillus caldus (strain SM-1) TaxID=990288 RepID=F9ZQK7_ACICS|nr:TcpQ domain-containing protein [Acidithiobacillus caldus]AEK58689.1 hypothetical protein Atc_2041 [Acidithiobacillus caldus SM-1]
MRIPALNTAILSATGALLCGCAAMHAPQAVSGIGDYQFGYTVHSPSHIAAQIFSGSTHTYVSLPVGVQLQAATGNGQLYGPTKKGPYWVLPALATHWSLATTKGVVDATATGAARQMARVYQAQRIIQATATAQSTAALKPVPKGTAHLLPAATAMPDRPAVKTAAPKATAFKLPEAWLHPVHHTLPAQAARKREVHRVARSPWIPGSHGRSLPLRTALHRIAPLGWKIHIGTYVSPTLPVLWHKGPWTQSLQRMARDNLLVSTVNRHRKTVTITASPAMLAGIPVTNKAAVKVQKKMALVPAVAPLQQTTKSTMAKPMLVKPHVSALPITPVVIHPVPPKVQAPMVRPAVVFIAHHGQMLSHDLRLYLHKQHWHLAWNLSKDYPIAVGFTLSGSVQNVLKHLMGLYPISVTAYAVNRTIVIQSGNRY